MPRHAADSALSRAFGKALRAYRSEQGMSQVDLGARAGLHATWIAHLESGRTNPTLSSIRRLSDALGIESWELIARAEKLERSTAAGKAKGPGASA